MPQPDTAGAAVELDWSEGERLLESAKRTGDYLVFEYWILINCEAIIATLRAAHEQIEQQTQIHEGVVSVLVDERMRLLEQVAQQREWAFGIQHLHNQARTRWLEEREQLRAQAVTLEDQLRGCRSQRDALREQASNTERAWRNWAEERTHSDNQALADAKAEVNRLREQVDQLQTLVNMDSPRLYARMLKEERDALREQVARLEGELVALRQQ